MQKATILSLVLTLARALVFKENPTNNFILTTSMFLLDYLVVPSGNIFGLVANTTSQFKIIVRYTNGTQTLLAPTYSSFMDLGDI